MTFTRYWAASASASSSPVTNPRSSSTAPKRFPTFRDRATTRSTPVGVRMPLSTNISPSFFREKAAFCAPTSLEIRSPALPSMRPPFKHSNSLAIFLSIHPEDASPAHEQDADDNNLSSPYALCKKICSGPFLHCLLDSNGLHEPSSQVNMGLRATTAKLKEEAK